MSSTFKDHHHHHPHLPKREPNENNYPAPSPSPSPSPPILKVNKDSHVIKKPPSPSSSSSAAKHRHPVIIYTHTPKIIHTNPKDFMALVQKLTGMSRSDDDPGGGGNTTTDRGGKSINQSVSDLTVDKKPNRNRCGGNNYHRNYSGNGNGNGKGVFFNNAMISEDSESSSVITTDENIGEHGSQVNSSLPYSSVAIPPPPHPPPPPSSMYDATGINYGAYLPTFPIFPPAVNPADNYLCGNQPFANFDDPLFFAPNMRSSFSSSSSSGFDGLTEFRDF